MGFEKLPTYCDFGLEASIDYGTGLRDCSGYDDVLRACIYLLVGLRASSDYVIGLRACSGGIDRSSREVFGTAGRPNIGFNS